LRTNALSWSFAAERAQRALRLGKLRPIPTRITRLGQAGISFVVRILLEPSRDAKAKPTHLDHDETWHNPFLPYDPDLFVADLTATHVCLLNKYIVLPQHLLIVTRSFERQDAWLGLADCEALWTALAAWDGLAFYNAGRQAGASQPHKHIQLVQLPLGPSGPAVPIAEAFGDAHRGPGVRASAALPFAHALAPVDPDWIHNPALGAARTMTLLAAMREALALDGAFTPYNLLATRDWLMLIPRGREGFDGVSVNAIGFAGAFLVPDDIAGRRLESLGPLSLLQRVGLPAQELP
jgi:ATP adenylyltransferase